MLLPEPAGRRPSLPDALTIAEHRRRIAAPEVCTAFDVLVGAFGVVGAVEVVAARHGYMHDIRFLIGGRNAFAFTAAAGWLHFYFRKPGITAGWFTPAGIVALFPDARPTGAGELSLHVTTPAQAYALAGFVLHTAARQVA